MPESLRKVCFDDVNGEIRLFGRRLVTIDPITLCKHLDSMVGEKVAAVIISKHARETGEEDVAHIIRANPNATPNEIIQALIDGDLMGGYGVAKIELLHGEQSVRAELEMRNPVIQGSVGTGVKLILTYWAGALGKLLNETLEVTDIDFDAGKSVLRCRLAVVGIPQAK